MQTSVRALHWNKVNSILLTTFAPWKPLLEAMEISLDDETLTSMATCLLLLSTSKPFTQEALGDLQPSDYPTWWMRPFSDGQSISEPWNLRFLMELLAMSLGMVSSQQVLDTLSYSVLDSDETVETRYDLLAFISVSNEATVVSFLLEIIRSRLDTQGYKDKKKRKLSRRDSEKNMFSTTLIINLMQERSHRTISSTLKRTICSNRKKLFTIFDPVKYSNITNYIYSYVETNFPEPELGDLDIRHYIGLLSER